MCELQDITNTLLRGRPASHFPFEAPRDSSSIEHTKTRHDVRAINQQQASLGRFLFGMFSAARLCVFASDDVFWGFSKQTGHRCTLTYRSLLYRDNP